MAKPLLPDELWTIIEPILPPDPPKPKGGRPRIANRAVMTGILFVLRTGVPWEMLPKEMGCGSGVTCWRRLRDWQASGVWDALWQAILNELGRQKRITWEWAALDSSSTRAVKGDLKQALTRLIERKPARSVTSSRTAAAFLLQSA